MCLNTQLKKTPLFFYNDDSINFKSRSRHIADVDVTHRISYSFSILLWRTKK